MVGYHRPELGGPRQLQMSATGTGQPNKCMSCGALRNWPSLRPVLTPVLTDPAGRPSALDLAVYNVYGLLKQDSDGGHQI